GCGARVRHRRTSPLGRPRPRPDAGVADDLHRAHGVAGRRRVSAAIVGTQTRSDLFVTVMASIGVAALLVIAYRRFVQQRPVTGPEAMRLPTRGFGIPRLRQRLAKAGIDPDSIRIEGGPRPLPEKGDELERQEN